MTKIAVGKKFPSISVAQSDGAMWKSSDSLGKNLVLYFYPKDMTSGCTIESQNFRDLSAAFKKAQAQVLGVSRDSCASHVKFRAKEKLPFELLADTDEKLCKLFDVIKEKNMYGKKVMGIERSTFLFDTKGVLIREWRKVKVDGHAAEVLATVQAL
jgi:thioredoxin-dependent peroxiredoxin